MDNCRERNQIKLYMVFKLGIWHKDGNISAIYFYRLASLSLNGSRKLPLYVGFKHSDFTV